MAHVSLNAQLKLGFAFDLPFERIVRSQLTGFIAPADREDNGNRRPQVLDISMFHQSSNGRTPFSISTHDSVNVQHKYKKKMKQHRRPI
jgi:hypothetical protein